MYFGLNKGGLDVARLAGFVVLSLLVIGLLLTWTWRFRREFWHRNNVMLLLSLLLLVAVLALKVSAGRTWLPYALPLAAIGMLVTVLLDAGDRDGPHRTDRGDRGRGQRRRLRARRLRDAGRDRRHRGRSARRPPGRVRPGGLRGVHRQRPRRADVCAAGRPGRPGRVRAARRVGGVGRRCRDRRGRELRSDRGRLRDPDRVPAARAGEPVPAAPETTPGRDAGHLSPLAHGGQPGRARRRDDRWRSAARPRGRVLPRHRQALKPRRLHREPGRG